jgi:hypothetical protein
MTSRMALITVKWGEVMVGVGPNLANAARPARRRTF